MLSLDYAKQVGDRYILSFFADSLADLAEVSNGKEYVTRNGTNYGVPLASSTCIITEDDVKKIYTLSDTGVWTIAGTTGGSGGIGTITGFYDNATTTAYEFQNNVAVTAPLAVNNDGLYIDTASIYDNSSLTLDYQNIFNIYLDKKSDTAIKDVYWGYPITKIEVIGIEDNIRYTTTASTFTDIQNAINDIWDLANDGKYLFRFIYPDYTAETDRLEWDGDYWAAIVDDNLNVLKFYNDITNSKAYLIGIPLNYSVNPYVQEDDHYVCQIMGVTLTADNQTNVLDAIYEMYYAATCALGSPWVMDWWGEAICYVPWNDSTQMGDYFQSNTYKYIFDYDTYYVTRTAIGGVDEEQIKTIATTVVNTTVPTAVNTALSDGGYLPVITIPLGVYFDSSTFSGNYTLVLKSEDVFKSLCQKFTGGKTLIRAYQARAYGNYMDLKFWTTGNSSGDPYGPDRWSIYVIGPAVNAPRPYFETTTAYAAESSGGTVDKEITITNYGPQLVTVSYDSTLTTDWKTSY